MAVVDRGVGTGGRLLAVELAPAAAGATAGPIVYVDHCGTAMTNVAATWWRGGRCGCRSAGTTGDRYGGRTPTSPAGSRWR